MPAPSTSEEFLALVRKSGIVDQDRLTAYMRQLVNGSTPPSEPKKLANCMIRDGVLSYFQSAQLLLGKWRGFTIGSYKVLERLGSGGMGTVYLCEHKVMRRRVAIKVLPIANVDDPSSLGRFHREAQAAAALDHPNIVRAHDFCQEGNIHFLVMEYINGVSLQEAVQKTGPMDPIRAAHYISQTAKGLQHAHETAGLIHRDIKPGNILVDRTGTVKILDMGLARFAHDRGEGITSKYDEKSVLGTADYLAPEQAMSSHDVDIRADIYSLGATFYFLLTGRPPFGDGTVAQKIIWHQMRPVRPVREVRPEVPEGMAKVVEKMLAKDPIQRYQVPAEVAAALAPWTRTPITPPAESEFRRLSPAVLASSALSGSMSTLLTSPAATAPMARDGAAGPLTRTRPPAENKPALTETPIPEAEPTRRIQDPIRTEESALASPEPGEPPLSDVNLMAPAAAATQMISEDELEVVEEDTDSTDTKHKEHPAVAAVDEAAEEHEESTAELPSRKSNRLLLFILVGVILLFLVGVAVTVLLLVLRARSRETSVAPPPSPPVPVVEKEQPKDSNVTPAAFAVPKPAPPRVYPNPKRLIVNRGGQKEAYPSIKEALAKAEPGDRILVQMEPIEEVLSIDGQAGAGKDVTIEGAANAGKPVTWRVPQNHPNGAPLISVANASGFCLKGFRFEGRTSVADVIVLSGSCPGLRLEDLLFEGLSRCAIRFNGCVGESSRPIEVQRIRTMSNGTAESALVFDAVSDQTPRFIQVADCRFEGHFKKAAICMASAVTDTNFERNRFFRGVDGFLIGKNAVTKKLQLRIASNTMFDFERGFHWEALPSTNLPHDLVVERNLFHNVRKLGFVDGLSWDNKNSPAQWIWAEEPKLPEGGMPAEDRYFRQTFEVTGTPIIEATVDAVCDDAFTIWLNGEQVAKSPTSSYTKHVYTFDVTKQVRPGKNVLAVRGSNVIDFGTGKPTDAGLLVQLTYATGDRKNIKTVVTDKTWKASKTETAGWQQPNFDDKSWADVKWQGAYNSNEAGPSRRNLLWDSEVRKHWGGGTPPIRVTSTGNVRDGACSEGFPALDARHATFPVQTDANSDARFLRYPKNSRLVTEGGTPGVPPADGP